jgi:hypothetical protein
LSIRGVWDNFERRCSFKSEGIRVEVYANPAYLNVWLHCESGVLFATPRPEPSAMSLLGQVAGTDVYVSEQGLGSPIPWIHSPAAVEALRLIDIGEGEQLIVHIGGANALLRSDGPESDWNRLQRIIAFALTLPPGAEPEALDPLKVPEDLRKLLPLVAKWGKSDDAERGDLVEGARTASLERLVDHGKPLLARIAEFLGRPDVSDSNEAALDAFAQAVMEAEQELRRRSDREFPND